MGDIAAIQMAPAQPSFLKLRPLIFVFRSMLLGVLAGIGGSLINLFALWVANEYAPGAVEQAVSDLQQRVPASWTFSPIMLVLYVTVGAPLIESLIFPPLYWISRWSPWRVSTFVTAITIAAWIAHGMTMLNLGQAFCFAIMATYYVELRRKYAPAPIASPFKLPYLGIVIAHAAWNSLALIPLLPLLTQLR